MAPFEIFGAAQSVYVRATRLAFEEKGVAYALTPASPHSPPIVALNPFGKIPAMRHGAVTLFESLAIMFYVDRVCSGPRLIPDDALLSAQVMQWACAINTSVFPSVVGYMQAHAFPKGADGKPDRDVVGALFPAVRKSIAVLDGAVAGTGFIAGTAFSIADMYLMPILAYLRTFPESGAALAESAHLSRYFARHETRESFVKTTPPPLAELAR